MQNFEYSSPFEATSDGLDNEQVHPVSIDGSAIETTVESISPVERRIEQSRWSRDDLELIIDVAGVLVTAAALWLAYERGQR